VTHSDSTRSGSARDETVGFGVFNGVSDNDRRWFSIDHARERIGYDPRDNGEEWDAPPE